MPPRMQTLNDPTTCGRILLWLFSAPCRSALMNTSPCPIPAKRRTRRRRRPCCGKTTIRALLIAYRTPPAIWRELKGQLQIMILRWVNLATNDLRRESSWYRVDWWRAKSPIRSMPRCTNWLWRWVVVRDPLLNAIPGSELRESQCPRPCVYHLWTRTTKLKENILGILGLLFILEIDWKTRRRLCELWVISFKTGLFIILVFNLIILVWLAHEGSATITI